MPAAPIPITTDRFTSGYTPAMTSNSPSSSISISPQTPFNSGGGALAVPNNAAMGVSPTNPSFFKWAAAAAQLGKSPPLGSQSPPADGTHQRGFDIPSHGHGGDEHEHEHHDSFEFGDLDDLRLRSWSKTRRAASMSAGPGPGGIASMISGFGASSPPTKTEVLGSSATSSNAKGAMAIPSGGVLADKNSKGQGVLRRLSLSGSNFTRVSRPSCVLGLISCISLPRRAGYKGKLPRIQLTAARILITDLQLGPTSLAPHLRIPAHCVSQFPCREPAARAPQSRSWSAPRSHGCRWDRERQAEL